MGKAVAVVIKRQLLRRSKQWYNFFLTTGPDKENIVNITVPKQWPWAAEILETLSNLSIKILAYVGADLVPMGLHNSCFLTFVF